MGDDHGRGSRMSGAGIERDRTMQTPRVAARNRRYHPFRAIIGTSRRLLYRCADCGRRRLDWHHAAMIRVRYW